MLDHLRVPWGKCRLFPSEHLGGENFLVEGNYADNVESPWHCVRVRYCFSDTYKKSLLNSPPPLPHHLHFWLISNSQNHHRLSFKITSILSRTSLFCDFWQRHRRSWRGGWYRSLPVVWDRCTFLAIARYLWLCLCWDSMSLSDSLENLSKITEKDKLFFLSHITNHTI